MKLLVTGASGFLGRYVVDEALRRGHVVRAMVRSAGAAARVGWDKDPRVEIAVADLRSRRALPEAVAGVDAVLHLAAAKAGDVYAQYGGTVVATENLLWAMDQADVRRIVHVSSFSVYDWMRMRSGTLVDESAPLEKDAFERDAYAHTKLVQERLVREHAGLTWTVLRPGMIIGPDKLWSARVGTQGKRRWVRMGARARLPITYVENVAEAIVVAAERDSAAGQVLNVVDDETPTQRQYVKLLRERTTPRPKVVGLPWLGIRATARLAWLTDRLLLGNRARLPGILVPCRVHARFKPLKYTNKKIKEALGWSPRYSLVQAIDKSLGRTHGLETRVTNGAARDTGFQPVQTTQQTAAPQPLRVAYMTGEYPRATDTFIQREVAALRASGVHVETLSVRRPSTKEVVSDEVRAERERTYYLLPANPLRVTVAHLGLLFKHPGRYFSALCLALSTRPPGMKALAWQAAYFLEAGLVARRLREHDLSHLHNHFSNSSCSVAMLAAALGGFTYSFTMHGPAEFYEPKYWRVDEKVRRAKFVACISHFARSQAMVFAPQEHWDKLHVVHCGVSPAQFEPRRHEGRGSRLLFVGRLAAVKGLPVLLEAVARLAKDRPDVTLVVAGDGPDRAKLEAQARRLGVSARVEFRGYQSQAQVRELLRQTDVFAMASFAEGVPVVLMEAMAAGVPVIATRIAGVPELVEDGVSGFLVPPSEPGAIAEKAVLLLDDANLRNRLGAAGRAKVEREFNVAAEAQRLRRIMTSALGATLPSEDTAAEAAAPAGVGAEHAESSKPLSEATGEAWRAPAPAGA
jgi:glycosyltransferase involved in cell wall biosynthesis/nucleoside-diphosphate-sugar epimerase